MCRFAEKAAAQAWHLRQQYGGISAAELARLHGVEIVAARWQVASGRIVYYGECTREPFRIVLNEAALDQVAEREQLRELVIAHELGHLLLPRPSIFASHTTSENAAHAFAQAWINSAAQSGLLEFEILVETEAVAHECLEFKL